ncbi:MAG TPA: FAD-dependent oxidoreductase [Gemmatimonadaceae bacterium]|nr:FAD-dependent oxidoreductase [Gemmatimonadaceae bacterium]
MAEQTQAGGPDLTLGVDEKDFPSSGMLAGHVGDDSVLVARVGNEYFAIGATCTHYGGPLGEGALTGDVVRCPWHHACFSVRTGEATLPPALNPEPTFRVERNAGRIVVREKSVPPTRKKTPARTPESVVIIGGGAAGAAAAETLRKEGYERSITIIDPDTDAPYDRPNLSKDYLAGNAPEEWIPLHPRDFYQERSITLSLGRQVASIDPRAKRVALDDGSTLEYDALLLATGAEPIRLPEMVNSELPIYTLRSLADSRAIIAAAGKSRRAIVLGASFIGLEVAASLRARDLEVHVVAPESRPLERVLGPALGDFIRALHEEKGVIFHLGHTAKRFGRSEVELDDGSRLAADFVVAGIGVRPRVALAEAAGLRLDRGVVVNERMETGAPGIWAAGDIARWPDERYGGPIRVEHWVVAERQGRTAARNILGAGERHANAPFFWSAHYDVSINYVGHAERWDATEVDGDPMARDVTVRFLDAGRVTAVATIFRDAESLAAEIVMERELAS